MGKQKVIGRTGLTAVIVTAVGPVLLGLVPPVSFQIWITGTSGTVSATVKIWGSNDPTCLTSQSNAAKSLLATSSGLSGTGTGEGIATATDKFVCTEPYLYYWAEVSAISGTGTKAFVQVAF